MHEDSAQQLRTELWKEADSRIQNPHDEESRVKKLGDLAMSGEDASLEIRIGPGQPPDVSQVSLRKSGLRQTN